nr:MAG TPA: hypothetical protein [Caudoviricetes sp.]
MAAQRSISIAAQITSRITTIFQCFFAKRFVGIVPACSYSMTFGKCNKDVRVSVN